MHEMSLCEGILRVIEEQAAAQRYRKVRTVWLEVGALAGVEVEALRFGFDVVMKGSIAADARLEVLDIPGRAWCGQCMNIVTVRHRLDACPECGGYRLRIDGGDELRIKELEVE